MTAMPNSLYLDTSFLLKLYVLERETSIARASLQQHSGDSVISSSSDVEVISALNRRLPADDALMAKAAYRRNRVSGLFLEREITNAVFERAVDIADVDAKQYKLKSLDILHLATALHYRVATVASFDLKMRNAAQALGLAVVPA